MRQKEKEREAIKRRFVSKPRCINDNFNLQMYVTEFKVLEFYLFYHRTLPAAPLFHSCCVFIFPSIRTLQISMPFLNRYARLHVIKYILILNPYILFITFPPLYQQCNFVQFKILIKINISIFSLYNNFINENNFYDF